MDSKAEDFNGIMTDGEDGKTLVSIGDGSVMEVKSLDEEAVRDFLYEVAYDNIDTRLGRKLYEMLEEDGSKDDNG